MKTAVIYARYSSDNQTEQSIEGQLRVCQETAKYKKILKDNGVKLLSAMENIPDTPEGIILESLLEGMAEYYSAELSQKVRRGMNESRLKGNYTGGPLPYGYKVQDKKIVIDEQRAEIVRYIFKEYSLDKSVGQIIKDLANNGVLYKGKPFKQTTLYKLLENYRYTGKYKVNGITYTNMFPKIVDEDIFNFVRQKMKKNKLGSKSVLTTYLFRNKLICGYCGMPISAESCRTRYKEKVSYYKCLGIKKYRNGCQKETIRKEVLEKFLLDTIISELKKPRNINHLVSMLMLLQNDLEEHNLELKILQKQKHQAELSLSNVMQAIENGVYNQTTNKRMMELEKEIALLEENILIQQAKAKSKVSEQDIRKYYEEALMNEPLVLINYVVKYIKLYNDKVEITFNTPLKASPDNQDLPFLIATKYLHRQISTEIKCLFYV